MMEFLFLDLDDTILDFRQAEHTAITRTLSAFGIDPTEEITEAYRRINLRCWKELERGTLTREDLKRVRFEKLFQQFEVEADVQAVSDTYMEFLGQGHWFLPGAEEAVERLSKKYRLFLASNGTASVQHGRMTSAGLYPYFEEVFVSQKIGHNKPSIEYFNACFAQVRDFDKSRCIMVGDSLSSDILGGINAGIATCWVAPMDKDPGAIRPDYRIESIAQLEGLLDTIKKEG